MIILYSTVNVAAMRFDLICLLAYVQYLQTIFVSMRAPRLDPEVNALDEELDAVAYADAAGHAGAQEVDCNPRAEHANAPSSQRASAALT